MFLTMQSYVYFAVVMISLIVLMFIFEDKLLALEEKFDRKMAKRKSERAKAAAHPEVKASAPRKTRTKTADHSQKPEGSFAA